MVNDGIIQQTDANDKVLTEPPALIKYFTYHTSGQVEYMGWAKPGTATSAASWVIVRNYYNASSQLTHSLFADGDSQFDNIWDNRVSLAYS